MPPHRHGVRERYVSPFVFFAAITVNPALHGSSPPPRPRRPPSHSFTRRATFTRAPRTASFVSYSLARGTMANAEDVLAGAADKQEEPAPRLASTFAELGLCQELVEACDAMQWKQPTRIQAETIPHALQGNIHLHSTAMRWLVIAVPGPKLGMDLCR